MKAADQLAFQWNGVVHMPFDAAFSLKSFGLYVN